MFEAYGNFHYIYYNAILFTVTELFVCGENQPTNMDYITNLSCIESLFTLCFYKCHSS